MKIRTGFVSNSSSSSFICQVSGETYSGYDCSIDDFGLVRCENGHLFHEDYLVNFDLFSNERKLEIAAKFDVQSKIYDYKKQNNIRWNDNVPAEVKENFEKEVKVFFDNMTEGELMVLLWNHSDCDFNVEKGDRICQFIPHGEIRVKVFIKNKAGEVGRPLNVVRSNRGVSGFGSTGAN